ncbi:MAG: hypothetical protein ABIG87_03325 [Patescibacteria group bacterium]
MKLSQILSREDRKIFWSAVIITLSALGAGTIIAVAICQGWF